MPKNDGVFHIQFKRINQALKMPKWATKMPKLATCCSQFVAKSGALNAKTIFWGLQAIKKCRH